MTASSKPMKTADIETFFATLQAANPHPETELEYSTPFELLVAVVLSAQATDVSVNKATAALFLKEPPTPQRLIAALVGFSGAILVSGIGAEGFSLMTPVPVIPVPVPVIVKV